MQQTAHPRDPSRVLHLGARAWFLAAMLGQGAFIVFILWFFGGHLAGGDLAGLNAKPHVTGYVPGDVVGNVQFVGHALAGALVTLSGAWQLVPALRRRWPRLHRRGLTTRARSSRRCGRHMMKPSGWGQWRCRVEWYWFRQDRFLWGVIREKTVPPVRRNSHSMRFISTRSGSTGSRCQTLSILDSSSGREQIGRSSGERIHFLKRQHSIP